MIESCLFSGKNYIQEGAALCAEPDKFAALTTIRNFFQTI